MTLSEGTVEGYFAASRFHWGIMHSIEEVVTEICATKTGALCIPIIHDEFKLGTDVNQT